MKTYQEMVREYQKRQRDTVVDTIATGLTYMDEIAVETGILEETGLLTELTEAACGALPFVMIAATEGTKVVLGGGDGQCSSVGAGSIAEGKSYVCAGSSAWVASASSEPVFDKEMRIVNIAHVVPGMYTPSGTMQSAGSAFNWVKNEICLDEQRRAREEGRSPYDFINPQIEATAFCSCLICRESVRPGGIPMPRAFLRASRCPTSGGICCAASLRASA